MQHTITRRFVAAPMVLATAIGLASCAAIEYDSARAPNPVVSASATADIVSTPRADAGPGALAPSRLSPPVGQAHRSNDACATVTRYDTYKVDGGDWTWSITGDRMDTGVDDQATGTPSEDLTTYVVASGDSIAGIGARFCVDSVHLALINHRDSGDIYAGETIRLYPTGPAADYAIDPDN